MKIGDIVSFENTFSGAPCTVIGIEGENITIQHAGGACTTVICPAAPVDELPAAPVAKKTTTTTKASKANG